MTLLDPDGNALAVIANSESGADAYIMNQILPSDGTYVVAVQAAPGDSTTTGHYNLAAYDASVDSSSLLSAHHARNIFEFPWMP